MSAYPAPRVVHGKSVQWTSAEEVLLLPFLQAGQDLHQIHGRSRPLVAMTGGVILPIEIPHSVAPVLEWLHPSHNARGHDSNHGQSGMSQQPYPAHQIMDAPVILLLRKTTEKSFT